MPRNVLRVFALLAITALATTGMAQTLQTSLFRAFGALATLEADGAYHVEPYGSLDRNALPGRLRSAMSNDAIPAGTIVRIVDSTGAAILQGMKARTGDILLSWKVDPDTHTPSQRAAPTAPPRSAPPANSSTRSTWGSECTSYQTGHTTGVRCRDSTGRTWGNECTSYQTGNTFGVRCRDW